MCGRDGGIPGYPPRETLQLTAHPLSTYAPHATHITYHTHHIPHTHTPHTNTPHTHTQFESEATSLKASLESTLRDLEEVQSSSQHRVRQLTQQLETARVAIQELEGAQDHCSELEREVAEVRGALNSKDTEICQLELVSGLYSHPLGKLCSTSHLLSLCQHCW